VKTQHQCAAFDNAKGLVWNAYRSAFVYASVPTALKDGNCGIKLKPSSDEKSACSIIHIAPMAALTDKPSLRRG
jgi:hypothetical protein